MNRFGLLGVWAFTLCGWLAGSAVWGQEGIIIPISNGGTVEVDCDSSELIYFTDDNSGSTDFQDPYSNTNYTITLCPSTPGDAVPSKWLLTPKAA